MTRLLEPPLMEGLDLRLLRAYSGLKQLEMAKQLGISNSYLSQLEAGNREISLDVLKRYAVFLDVPASSLLFFSENPGLSASEIQTHRHTVGSRMASIFAWDLGRRELELARVD